MQRHSFSTNIAFIPWNWRRSDSEVAKLFRENPAYFSISVHGCAHTRAEFGSNSLERLYGKAKQALTRMDGHESATGVSYDKIMVFPQGVFSEAAMKVLKRTKLIAAINNDTISSDRNPRNIRIADVWDTAIMAYSSFPLFTRRYPWEGVENFAFDSLLGKPFLIVVHHDFCRNHCAQLIEFIDKANGLARPPSWRSLGEVVRGSYRQQIVSENTMRIEMYASALYLNNYSEQPREFLIHRRECDPVSIKEVVAGNEKISWTATGAAIRFAVELGAGESTLIRIRRHALKMESSIPEKFTDSARIMLRRHFCELRDNYLHRLSTSSNGN
jgi:hypothetical protein